MTRGALAAVLASLLLSTWGCTRVQRSEPVSLSKTEKPEVVEEASPPQPDPVPSPDAVSAFVRRIFHDSKGSLWLGTNGDGVARYDGQELHYFSVAEGFGGHAVRGIVEDPDGNVWFATSGGVTRHDGESFVNFTTEHGLPDDDTWCVLSDRSGTLWVGTRGGACRFDGERFVPFPIPPADAIDPWRGVSTPTIVRCIMEDRVGNTWFATEGGVFRHDGVTLTRLVDEDGPCDESVNSLLEDRDGDLWLATHYNGICRYDGESFVNVSEQEGLQGTEAWDLYEDQAGGIWFPVERAGLHRWDGESFVSFSAEQGLPSPGIQCTHHDRDGRFWVGGYLGLYRLEGDGFIEVTRQGPW
ncbi:MAG: two-component regulator propeller domain-containing protein [Acidobacteriota bacterium]